MNVSDVYGTLYSPGDGTVDPAGYCTALVRAATRLGAKVSQIYILSYVGLTIIDFFKASATNHLTFSGDGNLRN